MGGSHAHGRDDHREVDVPLLSRILLLGTLALIAVVTVAGLVWLWPDQQKVGEVAERAAYAAPGVTFPQANIIDVNRKCAGDPGTTVETDLGGQDPGLVAACAEVTATLADGAQAGEKVKVEVRGPSTRAGLQPGDSLVLMRVPGDGEAPPTYSFFGVDRSAWAMWLGLAFFVVVVAVARWRGLLAVIGLVISGLVVLQFMLPALLVGQRGLLVTLIGSSAILYVVLYFTHGVSMRTSAALGGTLIGVGLTAAIAYFVVADGRLTGMTDETSSMLAAFQSQLDFRTLLSATVVIAGVGVLNDVTITQSSAVWELRAAGPELTRRQLFGSAMRIGRDHIASSIYTIVFAYAGAALSVLMLLFLYDLPSLQLLGIEEIATEVARSLCSAIGLVLAVPITTGIAAATVGGARRSAG